MEQFVLNLSSFYEVSFNKDLQENLEEIGNVQLAYLPEGKCPQLPITN